MLRTKLTALLMAGSLVFLCGCQSNIIPQSQDLSQVLMDPAVLGESKVEYKTGVVKTLVYEEEVRATSSTVSLKKDDLKWTQANSRLEKFNISKGSEVRAGQVLATFTVSVDKAKLESLKLQLEKKQQAVAAEKQKKQDAVDQATAAAEGLAGYALQIAQLKAQKLQVALEQYEYESSVEIAEIADQVAEIENAAANITLVAPYNGLITYVNTTVKEGDLINAKDVLVTIESLDKVYVSVSNLVQNSGTAFRYNMMVSVGGKEGKVIVSPNILPDGDSGTVLIDLTEGGNRYSKKALITSKVHEVYDVMLVSTKALQQADGYYYVNVLEGDILKRRRVTVALRNPEKYTWILEGLTDGQTVVYAN